MKLANFTNTAKTVSEPIMAVVGVIMTICILVILYSLPIMWLWNWLMPKIFNLPEINLWQSIGLNLLCQILLKQSTTVKNK